MQYFNDNGTFYGSVSANYLYTSGIALDQVNGMIKATNGVLTSATPNVDYLTSLPQNLATSATPTFSDVYITGLTMGVSAVSAVKQAIVILDKVNADQGNPSGFVSRTTSDYSYNLSTRTMTLSATGSSFEFYNRGKYFTKSTSLSANHTSAIGQYFLYLNSSGNFVSNAVNTPWEFEDTQVVQIYHNPTAATTFWRGPETLLLEERHGVAMDPEIHRELHKQIGTYVDGAGFAMNGSYSVATGTGTVTANCYGIDSGLIRDEDLPTSISAMSSTSGSTIQYPVFYKIGSSNEWRWYVNNIPSLHTSATNNPYYNLNTGGTWSLGEISTNNRYYNIYVFAVPFKAATSVYNYRLIWVLGQNLHTSLALAQAESVLSLDTTGFPFAEMAPLWQVTMRYNTAYDNATGRIRIEGTQKIIGTQLSITVGGTVTTHNNLAGRSDTNTHPATSISFASSTVVSSTDVNSAIDEVYNRTYITSATGTSADVLDGTKNWKTLFGTDGKILSTLYTSGNTSISGITGVATSKYVTVGNGVNTVSGYASLQFDPATGNMSASGTGDVQMSVKTTSTSTTNAAHFVGFNDASSFTNYGIYNTSATGSFFPTGGAGAVKQSTGLGICYANGVRMFVGANSANTVYIGSNATAASTPAMTVTSANQVGFLNLNPAYPIDVTGDINTSTMYKVGGTQISISGSLSDVSAVAPVNGYTLTYSSAISKYYPQVGTSINFGGYNDTMFPGVTWTSAASPADLTWDSIFYGNGLFVANNAGAATTSGVMTSPDGINWTIQTTPSIGGYSCGCYGNGIYVVVSTSTAIIWSTDAKTWTSASVNGVWNSVAYGNGVFVSISNNTATNNVARSFDGKNWSTSTALNTAPWTSVCYGNGRFVATTYGGAGATSANRIAVSTDNGITWAENTGPDINGWRDVVYGNGIFVAIAYSGVTGNGRVATSPDGVNWTSRSGLDFNSAWFRIVYGNGLFVAIAYSTGSTNRIATSPDGINWTVRTNPIAANDTRGLAYGNGRFIITARTGTGNRVAYSGKQFLNINDYTNVQYENSPKVFTNGITVGANVYDVGINWTSATTSADNAWLGVTYGNGRFVAVSNTGTSNRVATSPDGINWTHSTMPTDAFWRSVCYGNGMFVSFTSSGSGNTIATSPDGINWTARAFATDIQYYSSVYAKGLFVVVGSNTTSRIATSPDGINWTARTHPVNSHWTGGVCYGNERFVSVAGSGTAGARAMYSNDGITWTSASTPADNTWNSVAYGNGIYVAVASTGTANRIMTSPDGASWTLRTAPSDYTWRSVNFGNGIFVAVAAEGVGISTDGISWALKSNTAAIGWQSVCYGDGMFVAVSNTGTGNRIMYSGKRNNTDNNSIAYENSPKVFTNGITVSGNTNITGVYQISGTQITHQNLGDVSASLTPVNKQMLMYSSGISKYMPDYMTYNYYVPTMFSAAPTTSAVTWDVGTYDTAYINLGSTSAAGVTVTLTNPALGGKYQLAIKQHLSSSKTLTVTASGYTVKTPAAGGYTISTTLSASDLLSMTVPVTNELWIVNNKAFG